MQLLEVARRLGLEGAGLPLLLPGAANPYLPFAPQLSKEDDQVGWQLCLLLPASPRTAVIVSLHLDAVGSPHMLSPPVGIPPSCASPSPNPGPSFSQWLTYLPVGGMAVEHVWPLPAGSQVCGAYASAPQWDSMLSCNASQSWKPARKGFCTTWEMSLMAKIALQVIGNVTKLINFLTAGNASSFASGSLDPQVARELLPFMGPIVQEMLPRLSRDLFNRISARTLRELYVGPAV